MNQIVEKIYFKERQIFYISIIPAILLIILIVTTEFLNLGSKPMPLFATVFGVILFILIIIFSYQLVYTITSTHIYIKLGCILVRKIKVNDIQLKSVKKVNVPWYSGMGIRILNKGVLYNVKPGKGVKFETSSKQIVLGTSKPQEIINTLKRLCLNNKD